MTSINLIKLFRNFFLVLLLVGTSLSVQATHIIGGEITYDCLGDGNFRMYLTIYRDCDNGIADFDDPAYIGIFDRDSFQLEYALTLNDRDTLTPLVADSCLIPPNICVETTQYTFDVNLPVPVGGFYFSYFECCRNDDIVNIIDDESTGSIFLSFLSEDNYVDCNSSMKFNNWPPLAICVDEPINWDHGVDTTLLLEGTILKYKLCAPLNIPLSKFRIDSTSILDNVTNDQIFDRFDTVQWEIGFGEDRMLNGNPDISIDSMTGFITGTPEQLGRYVIGICVEEYDPQGVMLSYLRRDFQYNVTDCDNTFADFNLDSVYCFYEGDNYVIIPENITRNTVSYLWILDFNGDITQHRDEDPVINIQDTGYYKLTLISKPGTACADTFERNVHIVLTALDADFDVEIDDCSAQMTNVSFTDLSTTANTETIVDWEWSIDGQFISEMQNFDTELQTGIDYEITLVITTNQGCISTRTKTLAIQPLDDVEFDELYVCEGDILELNPNFNPDYFYTWITKEGDTFSLDPNPSLVIDRDTCFNVTISSSAGLGCNETEELCINFISDEGTPEFTCELIDPLTNTVRFTCVGENCDVYTVFFNGLSHPDSSATGFPVDYNYSFDQTEYDALFVPDLGSLPCGLDSIGCEGELFNPCCDYALEWSVDECTDSLTILFEIDTICSVDSIIWDIGGIQYTDVSLELVFHNGDVPIDVSYEVFLTTCGVRDSSFVIDADTINYPILDTLYKCGNELVFLNPDGPTDFDFQWSPGTNLSNPTDANPSTDIEETTLFTAIITDPSSGCYVTRVVLVVVEDFPDLGVDESVILCDSLVEYCVKFVDGMTYEWSLDPEFNDVISTDTCVNFVFHDGTMAFYLRATNSEDCITEYDIEIINSIIICKHELSYRLCAGDTIIIDLEDVNGNIGNWNFEGVEIVLDEGNGRIHITATEDATMVVTASNVNCTTSFDVFVDVFDNNHFVEASASPETVNKGGTTDLDARTPEGTTIISWSPAGSIDGPTDIFNPIGAPTEPTTYTVYSEDENGCDAFDSVFVDFTCLCEEPYLYIPNAFTPNEDNLNESFNLIAPTGLVESMNLYIYNRWGELVFQSDKLTVKWDGTHNGEKVTPDVYAYYLTVKCVGVEEEFYKNGNVTVLY